MAFDLSPNRVKVPNFPVEESLIFEVWKVSFSKFGKCHFRSKSFHYSDYFRSASHFHLILGKIESHVRELQFLLYRNVVTAVETGAVFLPNAPGAESLIFNNLNFRKLKVLEIEESSDKKFGKVAVSVSIAVSSANQIESRSSWPWPLIFPQIG